MPAHKELLAAILKNLGHPVPSDAVLSTALEQAFKEVKKAEGVDADAVKYALTLIPVEKPWVDKTFC
jgi:hypothetical protein